MAIKQSCIAYTDSEESVVLFWEMIPHQTSVLWPGDMQRGQTIYN